MAIGADKPHLIEHWRLIAKAYPHMAVLPDLFGPAGWKLIGTDLLASAFVDPRTARLHTLLDRLDIKERRSLLALARINLSRAQAISTSIAIGYLTLPFALLGMSSEIAPGFLASLYERFGSSLNAFAFGAVVTPVIYFFGHWQARRIVWGMELHQVLGHAADFADPDEDTEPFSEAFNP